MIPLLEDLGISDEGTRSLLPGPRASARGFADAPYEIVTLCISLESRSTFQTTRVGKDWGPADFRVDPVMYWSESNARSLDFIGVRHVEGGQILGVEEQLNRSPATHCHTTFCAIFFVGPPDQT